LTSGKHKSHGNDDLGQDLVDAVIRLIRYYGSGRRANFVHQVFSKAADYCGIDRAGNDRAPWQVYSRLCDFGLVGQFGPWAERTWQWQGDNLLVLNKKVAMFPLALKQERPLSDLYESGLFEKKTAWIEYAQSDHPMKLTFLVSTNVAQLLALIDGAKTDISVAHSRSHLSILPSAEEIAGLLSSRIDSPPSSEDIEFLSSISDQWESHISDDVDVTYLLRKRREFSPGFQYWIKHSSNEGFSELRTSDWVPLLLWWFGKRKWQIKYVRSTGDLLIPTRLFFMLPEMVRQSIVQHTMVWPNHKRYGTETFAEFASVDASQVTTLSRLYAPAFEIAYG